MLRGFGIRRLGAATVAAGGCALALAQPQKVALAQKLPPTEGVPEATAATHVPEAAATEKPLPPTTNWLWTIDGVQVRRNAAGETVYVDEATGVETATRPSAVPAEAYANRFRFPDSSRVS